MLGAADYIVRWLSDYATKARVKGFIVGVSGGVDSALCSTLCAMTKIDTLCVTLPIHQASMQVNRAEEHIEWLKDRYENVSSVNVDLSSSFDHLISQHPVSEDAARQQLTEANTRSRLRMMSLYYFAGIKNALVVGTGNKIEDFGVGFFTKYGDGGVDVSPIGDLLKSDVFAMSRDLGICQSILKAAPTDGLFGDDRSDEDQIGATYCELEWAMEKAESGFQSVDFKGRERDVFEIYSHRNSANQHKIDPVPVCEIPKHIKSK